MGRSFISIYNIEIGSVTADPVTNEAGNVLINAGTTLGKNEIILLKGWGIKAISIVANDECIEIEKFTEINSEEKAKLTELCNISLNKRIKWIPETNFEKELWNIGFISTMERLERKHNQS